MNALFIDDYQRFTPNKYRLFPCLLRLLRNHELRYLFWMRLYQSSNRIVKFICDFILWQYRRKYGIELPYQLGSIGGGIRMVHPWCITVNGLAKLGKNVTLYKGCVIGAIESGTKKGVPTIANNVTLYTNSMVCGNICIGNNVEIAAGAFVNFDVPDNSIVIGNLGIIHKKK